jgi:hypothetical protein
LPSGEVETNYPRRATYPAILRALLRHLT